MNLSMGFLAADFLCGGPAFKTCRISPDQRIYFNRILAGPYVTGFLSLGMVQQLRLIDDLALSFIALTAGGALHLASLRNRFSAIFLIYHFKAFF